MCRGVYILSSSSVLVGQVERRFLERDVVECGDRECDASSPSSSASR